MNFLNRKQNGIPGSVSSSKCCYDSSFSGIISLIYYMYFLFDSMDHCQRFTQSLKSLLKSTIVISFGVVIVATFTPFQCSMPNSFQNSFNPWNKQKSAGTRLELYGGWGRFATSNSETMSTVWFSKLSWFDIQLLQIYFRTRGTQFGNRLILHSKTL